MKEEDGIASVKLSFGVTVKTTAPKVTLAPIRSKLLGAEDDDEVDKKKRALIPLSYSDEEDDDHDTPRRSEKSRGKGTMSSSERDRKERALFNQVPTKREAIWSYSIDWSTLSEVSLQTS